MILNQMYNEGIRNRFPWYFCYLWEHVVLSSSDSVWMTLQRAIQMHCTTYSAVCIFFENVVLSSCDSSMKNIGKESLVFLAGDCGPLMPICCTWKDIVNIMQTREEICTIAFYSYLTRAEDVYLLSLLPWFSGTFFVYLYLSLCEELLVLWLLWNPQEGTKTVHNYVTQLFLVMVSLTWR